MITDPKPPRALAFYFRVSTDAQEISMQQHALREFCRRHGWKLPKVVAIFMEKRHGHTVRRTQLDLLCQACRDGKVDTILCYALDRIGNDVAHMANLLAEWDRLKIRVVGVSDNIDTAVNNAATNLYRNMIMAWAQSKREINGERTKVGLAAARKRGRVGGRPEKKKEAAAAALAELRGQAKAKNPGTAAAIAKKHGISKTYLSMLARGLRKL